MPLSTVSTILARIGLGRLSRFEPPEPPNRYQRQRPGELLLIDMKKLGRIGRNALMASRRCCGRQQLGVAERRGESAFHSSADGQRTSPPPSEYTAATSLNFVGRS